MITVRTPAIQSGAQFENIAPALGIEFVPQTGFQSNHRAIIESLGAESLVDFRVTASVETSALESLSGVQEVRVETDRVILHVESAHTALPLILDWSRDAGVAIDDLRTHRPNLEDVFVSLTGRQLRDG